MPYSCSAADDARCKTCVYHGTIDLYTSCEYILVTGHRRGCEAGVRCNRYFKGNNRRRAELLDMEGKPRNVGRPRSGKVADINMAAYTALREKTKIAVVERAVGCKPKAISNAASSGRINIELADAVKALYGIDLIL